MNVLDIFPDEHLEAKQGELIGGYEYFSNLIEGKPAPLQFEARLKKKTGN